MKRSRIHVREWRAHFLSKVDTSGDCHQWTGAHDSGGWGTYRSIYVQRDWPHKFKTGSTFKAHRVAYYIHHGELDEFLDVHHTCRNRSCVNPDHLEAVGHSEHGRITRLEAVMA